MLDRLQGELESIYRVEIPHRAVDFIVDREFRDELRPDATSPEELLVVQDEDGLSLGLYLDPALLSKFAEHDLDDPDSNLLGHGLETFTMVLEGLSHFVYLVWRGLRDREVSLLELEAQAEVDKFVIGALHLWRRGRKAECTALRRRLFTGVTYLEDLDSEALHRYRTANSLANRYCKGLERRYLGDGSPEGLLREVRALYRMGGSEKLSMLALH